MSITARVGSVVATADQQIGLSTLFSVTPAASDPTYLILSGLDRDEYTAGYNTADMGSLSGDGTSQTFTNVESDAWSVGIVFTYQASTGRYHNATYGYFDQMSYTASSNTNDNASLSFYTTSDYGLAMSDAANPYSLEQASGGLSYAGSVSVVTQPSDAGSVATQATPDSICSAALSFVGKAWNMDGCWVLTSNISALAGASLPASSTLVAVPGVANGEWIVAYNGPVSASGSWELKLTAGEMVDFVTTSGGGHITTVVSGSGSSAMLVDNITYVNGNGSIQNAANDGSAKDIIIAAPHGATQEFNGVNPSDVVVYELDTPTVSDAVASVALAERASQALASLFTVSNPVASQAIAEWQIYDTDTNDSITVGGVSELADHSATTATMATSLSTVDLLAGTAAGSDTIEVRAYNGSYWGDWQSLSVTVKGTSAPTVTDPTANQTWTQTARISLVLPANTFTDPQSQTLTYTAGQSNGQSLPAWLSFNAATRTFSGTAPTVTESLSLTVTATDSGGLSATETFGATIAVAAAPTITDQTANQTWTQNEKFSLVLPATTFTDPQGEALTYTASQSDGLALPSWLGFNAATATFSGTAPTTPQNLTLKVTATDTSGMSASETFNVTAPAAAAPTITNRTANQTWLQGQRVSLELPARTFTDPQNETLTYTASQSNGQGLPAWLSFNATTVTFSGTVPAGMETLTLKVTATDISGVSTTETFGVTVPAISPTLAHQTAAQTWFQRQAISLTLPANTFTDPQSEALTYSVIQSNGLALPAWLSFSASTDTLSGTVPSGMESLTLKVIATGTSGLSASETFGVSVPAAAPSVVVQTADQTWTPGQRISLALPADTFTDPQGEKLTYTASQTNGQALPSWLSFNGSTDTFSGTVPVGFESLALKITATDTSRLAESETFGVTTSASAIALAPAGTSSSAGTVSISASNSQIDPGAGSYRMQFLANSGNDTIMLHGGGSDAISGFNMAAGDSLDLRSLIAESHLDLTNVSANLEAYVTVSDQGANAALFFDPSGHGGGSVVAILDNLGSAITNLAGVTSHGGLAFS